MRSISPWRRAHPRSTSAPRPPSPRRCAWPRSCSTSPAGACPPRCGSGTTTRPSLRVQVRVFKWTTVNGKNVLTATHDVVAQSANDGPGAEQRKRHPRRAGGEPTGPGPGKPTAWSSISCPDPRQQKPGDYQCAGSSRDPAVFRIDHDWQRSAWRWPLPLLSSSMPRHWRPRTSPHRLRPTAASFLRPAATRRRRGGTFISRSSSTASPANSSRPCSKTRRAAIRWIPRNCAMSASLPIDTAEAPGWPHRPRAPAQCHLRHGRKCPDPVVHRHRQGASDPRHRCRARHQSPGALYGPRCRHGRFWRAAQLFDLGRRGPMAPTATI